MPILRNPRHERFAQELAAGCGITEAYVRAGYDDSPASATRLSKKVKLRVDELRAAATTAAAQKLAITEERVLAELAKIGFADIRKAVEWHGTLVQETDNPDGGDVLIIKNIFSNHVRLIDSSELDESIAAAIAEVRQSPTGGLSIKLHDKQAALVNIGKHIGMFIERKSVDITKRYVARMPIPAKDIGEWQGRYSPTPVLTKQ